MTSRTSLLAVIFLSSSLGCPMEEESPSQNDAGCVDGWQDDFLGEVPAIVGDVSCFVGTLTSTQPPAECQIMVALDGQTVDHQSSEPIPSVAVDVYYGNDANQAADLSFTSDAEGQYDDDIPVCQALAYRTSRADADEAAPTLQQHKVLSPKEQPVAYDFRSVAWSTVNLITSPLFFGVEIEEGKGMVFGQAVGCDYEALSNVQVLVRDANCRVPEGSLVGYTANELPAPGERATTADGYYFVMNLPPGDYVLEMYRFEEGNYELIGSSPSTVEADGVSLVDVFIGRDDGQVMPEECLSCEE